MSVSSVEGDREGCVGAHEAPYERGERESEEVRAHRGREHAPLACAPLAAEAARGDVLAVERVSQRRDLGTQLRQARLVEGRQLASCASRSLKRKGFLHAHSSSMRKLQLAT